MPVIDVHTHMFTRAFMELLKAKGGIYNLQTRPDGQVEIFRHDTPVAIPQRGHFDYELRLRDMDAGAYRHGDRLADLPERLLGHRGRQLRGGARIQRQHGRGAEALARPHPLVHLAALGISAARRRGTASGAAMPARSA